MIKVYNSLTNKKEEFIPKHEKQVNMYVCGPTVYNHIHIGNARPIIVFDIVRNFLKYVGYDVKFVSNITDVDDKIINKAIEEQKTEEEITKEYIDAYINVVKDLNVDNDIIRPKVTDNMEAIISFIQELVDKGFAYTVNGDVYFRVKKLDTYGELSNQNVDDLRIGARIEENTQKEDALDFALWKKTDVGIKWQSPFGEGRPGWHTECVVLIDKYFHEMIDIHGGGMDLKFPHHENEIAQSKAVNNHALANYWMHNGFININNEKMSKSIGNVLLAKDMIDEYGANVIKISMLKTHYRQPINFSDDLIEEAQKINERIRTALKQANLKIQVEGLTIPNPKINAFVEAMQDDFNTPNAITELFEELKLLNNAIRSNDVELLTQSYSNMNTMNELLGLVYEFKVLTAEDQQVYIQWLDARKNKDFNQADQLRTQLIERDIV